MNVVQNGADIRADAVNTVASMKAGDDAQGEETEQFPLEL
jgi:hypothetical protein